MLLCFSVKGANKNAPDRISFSVKDEQLKNYPRCHLEFTAKAVRFKGYKHIPGN